MPHPILWTDNFGSDVSISLYHNGIFTATLTNATPSDGHHDWIPGSHSSPGSGYSIRVASVTNPSVYDQSDTPFDLAPTLLTKSLYLPNVLR